MDGGLFPPIEPHEQGALGVTDGHLLRFEVCGNLTGIPALFLHGGPGSSTNPGHRRFFDPSFYRIVLFDQRGCGRSAPRGAIAHNTTAHLIADIERLREHLGVSRWMVFGGSWGSTLALAYAQAHPASVSGMVLRGLFLASRAEVDWFLEGLRRFVPEAWAEFAAGAPAAGTGELLRYYVSQALGSDRTAALGAARRWAAYESALMAVGEAPGTPSPAADDDAVLDRVRVHLHYLASDCFLRPGQLLGALAPLARIPTILVQGRRDLVCPPATAYTVKQAWPAARLCMVEEGGHSAAHPAMAAALLRATEDMKMLLGQTPG
ncbi:MAG TPA: prolyl aminopeptidase [Burkholderiales bacterium]|jgi:proline iminopeptidase